VGHLWLEGVVAHGHLGHLWWEVEVVVHYLVHVYDHLLLVEVEQLNL